MHKPADKLKESLPIGVLLRRLAVEVERVSDSTERLQNTTEALIVYSGAEQFETLQLLDGVHQNLVEFSRVLHSLANNSADEWTVAPGEFARQIRLNDLADALLDARRPEARRSIGELELF